MILFWVVLRSLRQHRLSTLITVLSIALAGGLLMSVWALKSQAVEAFTQANSGFDAILGARGAKLQLVLSSIFHLEASPGNLSAADYEVIRKHPLVKQAIPIAVGDNLRGYRIVGTVPELFTEVEYAPGRHYGFESGECFRPTEREAVLGSFAARKLKLKIGDTFHPFHGLVFDEKSEHEESFRVVGILSPSNTPADQVVWIPLHGLQSLQGHDPKASSEISAVLLQLRTPSAGFTLDLLYNKQGNRLTLAYPLGAIMAELFSKIAWFNQVLSWVAYLVAWVSAAGVLVAIYNSMNSRKRDLAILRALGAGRRELFGVIVCEATMIGVFGMALAFVFYLGIVSMAALMIRDQTGIMLDPWKFHPVMLWAPGGMVGLCALAGLLPAVQAYGNDVAENLSPIS